jgi:hypothetical protein
MTEQSWQTPPDPIDQILKASPTPKVIFSPTRQWFLGRCFTSVVYFLEKVLHAPFQKINNKSRTLPRELFWFLELEQFSLSSQT